MARAQRDMFNDDSAQVTEDMRQEFFKKIVWTDGVQLLVLHGIAEGSARAFLGKRLKEIGADALALGIANAVVRRVREPQAYLGAVKALPTAEASPAPQRPDDSDDDTYMPEFFEDET